MNLGKVIKCYRIHKEISLRTLAIDIDVSAATLSRIENSNFKPDIVTFNKILQWLLKEQTK